MLIWLFLSLALFLDELLALLFSLDCNLRNDFGVRTLGNNYICTLETHTHAHTHSVCILVVCMV
jgi:hypothetical protein